MTENRAAKREIRELQQITGLSYTEITRLKRVFDEVLEREPHLNLNGFGLSWFGTQTLAERREQARAWRDELRRSAADVIEVCQWLRENIRPIKTPQQRSYGLKHLVEQNIGKYVSNGELIAAALMAGYPMGPIDGPNTVFGMSQRDVNRLRAGAR
ncbi:hypothetical protein [Actinosynnema mirum]|uniref:Uncharacterized protein n=1 Tax=Actinosynnema mirum (strain ATCC 29888 / DSM 43827 / JCM 3225 / NBRC 14064 / NCIMB 13271 / NRRL B-12336 / IMRU 3971 / 101) TaxID=446462 RepID=C6WJB5_ACTMD|nr:hypothetical protein [Actinosynnema mirum]ACU34547.1 conserved hypothetical protein [Actinosynnema mirum DSM 43827]